MPNEQLVAYVRDQVGQGIGRTEIARALLTSGWPIQEVNAAFTSLGVPMDGGVPPPPPILPPQPTVPTSPSSSPYVPPAVSMQSAPAIPSLSAVAVGGVPGAAISPAIKYAGFWVRLAAVLVDGLVLGVMQFGIVLLLGDETLGTIVSLLVTWGYVVFMITAYQATLGKMAVGLRIERVDGTRVGLGRVLLREIVGKFLSMLILGIGYLMVAWTQKKQGLHDKIADTVVIENDPTKSKTVWVVIAVLFALLLPVVGIFSAIVLSSLNSARMKGNDAAVQANLSSVAMQAELYYSDVGNGSYLGYCNSPTAISYLSSASRAGTTDGNIPAYVCNDSATAYAASVPLRTGDYRCVDSTPDASLSVVTARPLANGETSCGQ